MKRMAWAAAVVLTAAVASAAGRGVPLSATARMPVREITVFKDGHVFVLHEGAMPTDASGHVVLDYVPSPVMGTFWPYSADPAVKLKSVVAGRQRVQVDRTAMNLRELLEGNVGADVTVKLNGALIEAKILKILDRSSEELEATAPPNTGDRLPQKGTLILLQMEAGVRAVPINQIADVTFKKPPRTTATSEEFRNLLSLRLDWGKKRPAKTARAGLLYLQKGIRWIPQYRVELDGKGKAKLKLQAMLLNELADVENVTAHLVIGVPTFEFKDTPDPIGLQQTAAQLSRYFQQNARTAYAMSNAIMTQHARMGEHRRATPRPRSGAPNLGPDIGAGGKSEDLFVFTVKGISLRKGERMVLPVAEFEIPYEDVYTLAVPFAPPPQVSRQLNNQRQQELARLFNAPKVVHNVRLTNASKMPLTTAPALIVRDGRVLGQGMMTYTAMGGTTDLRITAAIDVQVSRTDYEVKKTPNAATWSGHHYDRFDLEGVITLVNHLDRPVKLEVTRHVLGNADSADNDGVLVKLSAFDRAGGHPHWWGWYRWPYWWHHFNGTGRITWNRTLKPGKTVKLKYAWHYFWRR